MSRSTIFSTTFVGLSNNAKEWLKDNARLVTIETYRTETNCLGEIKILENSKEIKPESIYSERRISCMFSGEYELQNYYHRLSGYEIKEVKQKVHWSPAPVVFTALKMVYPK